MYYKRLLPRPIRRDGSSRPIKEEEEQKEHLLQRGLADDCHHQQQPAEETDNEQSILLTNMSFESSEKAAAAAAATTTQQPAVVDNDRDVEQHDVAMGPSEANNDNKIGDGGARQAELMELAWGKHGRWWIFFGLAVCMIA